MHTIRILAAVVTHNRKDLLMRCITYINNQSRAPDEIVVIDNASTDGTQDMLGDMCVRSIRQGNLGSAGGWKRCIQVALDEGFDAVWLMDDDGYPDVNALKILENSLSHGVSAVSSIVLNENDNNKFVFPFPILDKDNFPILFSFRRKVRRLDELKRISSGGSYPFAHFFNGALIPISSVNSIGTIDDRYFIVGEEVDYFNRLSSIGDVRSILSALHYHPDVSKRQWSRLKFFYFIKNTIILNHKIYNSPYVRDFLTVFIALTRVFLRNGPISFLSYVAGLNSHIFYGAIIKGLRGRIEKDFNG